MGEDSTRAEERSSANLPFFAASSPAARPDGQEPPLLVPSFSPNSAPASPVSTLSRLGLRGLPSPGSPTSPTGGQVSAITVVALLDKLVAMMESVQENQRRAEKRQVELEAVVRGVQGDVTRLAKSHSGTANSVSKLLERSRKTGGNVKEVRERLDRQSIQVKRLEANHAHLLKRNHFKVIIFQEDNEIPSTLLMKDPASTSASLHEVGEAHLSSPTDCNGSHEEGLQTISLTSDEDEAEAVVAGTSLSSPRSEVRGELPLDEEEDDGLPSLGSERQERSRAEKLKRSSLKKVDSLKKAFSRHSIEKKMNKIVPPERREKIRKSFTPNHPKSPTAKSSSFHVTPMTFNVKKVREGAHVDVPSLGGPDGELPLAEVHHLDEKEPPLLSASTTGSVEGGLSASGEVDAEVAEVAEVTVATATLAEEEVLSDHKDEDDDDDDDNDDDNDEEEERVSPVASATSPVNTAVAVEQAS
ncbi:caveolae-associated protein 2a [Clupea harengus]|uniref:Caveolae-associated protein 2a n=1 Tax=Clupea harengus TaxID=7950 RepID=A0A6P3W901_CLUHA|nr:caveolae-associated protein 2a [Clupea harengus]